MLGSYLYLLFFVLPVIHSARDCLEIYEGGITQSGVYKIEVIPGIPINVSCDMSNGGGWTVFQRRSHDLVSFELDSFDYLAGFGLPEDDYWLGLDNINVLSTKDPRVELRIDLWDCQGQTFYEHYNQFSVGDDKSDYKLSVGGPSGTAGDAFSSSSNDPALNQNGRGFTTTDVDNDTLSFGNCADLMTGGWWFSGCGQANLNGKYIDGCKYQPEIPYGIVWGTLWDTNKLSAYKAEMKLRKGSGTQPSTAADCYDVQHTLGNTVSGVYSIQIPSQTSTIQVYCDLGTDGGGWTVFQRRFNGAVDFTTKSYNEYQYGFGDANDEYWLGLENIHQLAAKDAIVQMRVDLTDCTGSEFYESYSQFKIGNAASYYNLSISAGRGTAGDSFNVLGGDPRFNQNGMAFSTSDSDHDGLPFDSCPNFFAGGWWYNACGNAHLNSRYYSSCIYESNYENGITWNSLRTYYSFKTVKMMLRRVAP